jgi:FtsP/CotA-like multicopper oxidase with cupredoxin domain
MAILCLFAAPQSGRPEARPPALSLGALLRRLGTLLRRLAVARVSPASGYPPDVSAAGGHPARAKARPLYPPAIHTSGYPPQVGRRRKRGQRTPHLLRLAVLVVLLAGSGGLALSLHSASGRAFGDTPLADTFTAPPVLVNRSSLPQTVEVDLTAEPTPWSLIPGKTHTFWTFNGRVPGPTLELREGDRVIIHFHNKLPESTTVHWHGLPVPVEADGNPMDPVLAGGSYDYVFTIPYGTAGTYWYHPHPHGRAARQVGRGLYGAIIVRAADDPLPASIPEKLLILTDAQVTSYGSIVFPGAIDEPGWEGNVVFVNGTRQPTIALRRGEVQRWRVINASLARYYRLVLQGHDLLQVGSDGGLFERPVMRSELLLAPADRVELLVQGTGEPGQAYVLQSLPYDRYWPHERPRDWDRTFDLLTVRYTDDPPMTPPAIPATLRPVPALDPAQAVAVRTLHFDHAMINHHHFDPNHVDFSARLGDTDLWAIHNGDQMDHPFHLHGFRFQVLERNGAREPFPAWEDTVNVPKGQSVLLIVQYRDHPGKRMFHCHILDHEDYGMMGILEVR